MDTNAPARTVEEAAAETEAKAPHPIGLLTAVEGNAHGTARPGESIDLAGFMIEPVTEVLTTGLGVAGAEQGAATLPHGVILHRLGSFASHIAGGLLSAIETLAAEPVITSPVADEMRTLLPKLITRRLVESYQARISRSATAAKQPTKSAVKSAETALRLLATLETAVTEGRIELRAPEVVQERIAELQDQGVGSDELFATVTDHSWRTLKRLAPAIERLPETFNPAPLVEIILDHRLEEAADELRRRGLRRYRGPLI